VTSRAITVLCLGLVLETIVNVQAQQQSDLTAFVVVRLESGKDTYRIGEEIPLELEFRGTSSSDYYFSTETYDRSGRLFTEQYNVTPAGSVIDPLSDLFANGYIGGGGRSEQPLNDMPFVLHVRLNDWVRFTKPGQYRLVVNSARLHRRSSQSAPELTSNAIDFTITARDDAWEAAQLKRASALIDSGKREDIIQGTALLRYLDSEQSAKAVLDRYDAISKASAWDVNAALVASSYRSLIIQQLEARLDGRADIDANLIPTLVQIRALREVPPASGNGSARLERIQSLRVEYDARRQAALSSTPVTATTLREQLERFQSSGRELQEKIARDLEANPGAAAAAFVGMSQETGTPQALLENAATWPLLNRAWIVPALRQIYDQWNGNQNRWSTGDIALRRLYEVSPEEARRLILEEIRTGAKRIGYEALAILPEESLPELDDPLRERYSQSRGGGTTWLIARYGSATLLPFVKTTLMRGMACSDEAAFIVYLLKYEPATALQRFSPNLDRSGGCVVPPLDEVSARYWDDRLESAAITQLRGNDSRNVADAAQVLAKHASLAARQPLFDRLTQWSAEWKGREGELSSMRPDIASPLRVENSLTNALLENKQFALTKDDVSKILELCVSNQCRTNVTARGNAIH